MCDLGVSDSKSSHSYPFFSAYIVVWYFFGRNGVATSCILVLFVVVQILFHSSLSALVVEASGSWCAIGMLDSFVRSVVAFLA